MFQETQSYAYFYYFYFSNEVKREACVKVKIKD